MKKIFSLSLMAVALLISGNAKAAYVAQVGTEQYESFDEALAALGQKSGTIDLLDDCNQTNSMLIYSGQTVTLNLGNHVLTSSKINNVNLFHGHLIINAKQGGELKNTWTKKDTWNGNVLQVYGSSNPAAENHSVLDVHGVKITSANSRGIHIYQVAQAGLTEYSLTTEQVPLSSNAFGVVINIDGTSVINGKVYGMQITGGIKATEGNIPNITIGRDVIVMSGNQMDNAGIYGGGYGNWTIYGTVMGATGIYIKGGNLTLVDATVTSTADVYTPVGYKDGKQVSGVEAGGSAIVIEGTEDSAYPGGSISITGDCVITSEVGYALEARNLGEGSSDKIESISITGGTLVGSEDKGCLNMDPQVKSDVKEVKVTGTTFENITPDDQQTIAELVGTDGIITPIETEDGTTKYVVTTLPSGTQWVENDINGAAENSYVKYSAELVQPQVVELAGSKSLACLKIENATTIKIGAGEVLKVDEIILGTNAVIDVAPTGKLIVNGASGIIAFNEKNLVLHADAASMATFVLNPAVKSNRSPYATVEFACKGYTYPGTSYIVWDIFSSPFSTISSIQGQGGGSSYFQYWDGTAWTNCTSVQEIYDNAIPFKAFAISNSLNTPGKIYTFKGELQGNITGQFTLSKGFNYMGNGYTATLKTQQIINKLKASPAGVKAALYVWNAEQQRWDFYNSSNLEKLNNVGAMSAFVLYSTEDEDVVVDMDYSTMVWDINK